jgi:hypothetical protein
LRRVRIFRRTTGQDKTTSEEIRAHTALRFGSSDAGESLVVVLEAASSLVAGFEVGEVVVIATGYALR